MLKIANIVLAIVLVFVTSSCSKDEEESPYSTMTAEFVMLHISAAKTAVKAVTDKDGILSFSEPLTVSWATAADTTYRALLYYNKVEDSNTVKAWSARSVGVLNPRTPEQAKKWSDERDPIDIASAWRSSNGRWLNLNLAIKTGTTDTDDTAMHTLGLVCDSIVTTLTGRLLYCTLCHGQNNIPTYYTATSYASIPIENPTDSLVITTTTWSGSVTKKY